MLEMLGWLEASVEKAAKLIEVDQGIASLPWWTLINLMLKHGSSDLDE